MSLEEIESLRSWFLTNKRSLPWREDITPYRVWISEVMLQQTRAEVVSLYFLRWLKLFPDLASLAKAPLEAVIKAWEGLGYYSRARQLHQTAKYLIENFQGQFPECESELLKLQGIGPYTAAAIAAFAHHQKATPLDGNAIRVLARWNALEKIVNRSDALKSLKDLFWHLLPDERPWEIAEAIIELGAMICKTKNPNCKICPLKRSCQAYLNDQIEKYPIKPQKAKSVELMRLALFLEERSSCRFITRKSIAKGVMNDLWEFPHLDLQPLDGKVLIDTPQNLNLINLIPSSWLKVINFQKGDWSPLIRHTFTRYRVQMRAIHLKGFDLQRIFSNDDRWQYALMTVDELKKMPFSAGHRRLLGYLER